eukprot:XP_001706650.1 Hypothetical protein GL50803_91951 [Giardia lamblia ATCC 50803]
MCWYGRTRTLLDFSFKGIHVRCHEWGLQGTELVDDAAKGPYVCLLCVGLLLEDLYGHVEGGADVCLSLRKFTQ